MTKHCRVYMKYFGYGEQDFIPCEACGVKAVDIHHINGRVGGDADNIKNLMALCRKCHEKAHTKLQKSDMQLIHNYFLTGQRKQFL